MKTLTTLVVGLLLSAGVASAQSMSGLTATSPHSTNGSTNGTNNLTGYHYTYYPGYNPVTAKAAPNPKVELKPTVGGIFVDGAKYGWTIISPAAPATWGNGEKYMTSPDPRKDILEDSGPASHRQSGGFKLFSIDF